MVHKESTNIFYDHGRTDAKIDILSHTSLTLGLEVDQ
jgi:hypothetical protein